MTFAASGKDNYRPCFDPLAVLDRWEFLFPTLIADIQMTRDTSVYDSSPRSVVWYSKVEALPIRVYHDVYPKAVSLPQP